MEAEGVQTECTWCGDGLSEEEVEYPERDEEGDIICEVCWSEHFRAQCQRCEEMHDKTDLRAEPGSIIAVWRPSDGLYRRLRRGYYRVKSWPFFMSGLIEGFFLNDALERLGPLDEEGRRVGRDAQYASAPLCPKCRGEVESFLAARAA